MKILMQGRLDLFRVGGGDLVQIQNTADELKKIGLDVDISTTLDVDYSGYDLVHVFQLDWTPESYLYAKKAKKHSKPLVVSPIHHSVEEVSRFDNAYVFGLRRLSKILFREQHSRDTFKNVYRSFFDFNKVFPTVLSLFVGLKRMHEKTLSLCDAVLVQTEAEAYDLKKTYGVDINYYKVPNGVGEAFVNSSKKHSANKFDFDNYILCVGRIEPRKNQISVIEAVKKFREANNLDTKLVFIGRKSTSKHFEYVTRFNKLIKKNDWISHLPSVDYKDMPAVYKFAKVCVSASWFETTGLTSLEAIFCGANSVASGERAHEYLGEVVSYCDPSDVESITKAITIEYFAQRPQVDDYMLKEYTWENAARKTKKVYEEILAKNVSP